MRYILLWCLFLRGLFATEALQQSWNDTAIVVSSCDKYSDLWPGFFHYFYKNFPETQTTLRDVPIYLLSNTKTWADDRVEMILNPHEKCWGESMKNALSQINKKYVFFILEDLFLREPVDLPLLTRQFDFMQSVQSPYIQVFPTATFEDCPIAHQELLIKQKHQRRGCKSALQVAFWEKETFFDFLSGEEGIWAFESNPKAYEDTRPWLVSSLKSINYRNIVDAGRIDPHEVDFLQEEVSFQCSLPHLYDAITNRERFFYYGGISGNNLYWRNRKGSVDILLDLIKSGADFDQVLSIAKQRRQAIAEHQGINTFQFFSMMRNSVEIPFIHRCKISCQYPLMREQLMDTLSSLEVTTDWTDCTDDLDYTYNLKPIDDWKDDPLVQEYILSSRDQNNPFLLYDYELLKEGTCPVDRRFSDQVKKYLDGDRVDSLKIGLILVREKSSKIITNRLVFVTDSKTKEDLSDVPFTWIAPMHHEIDMQKCATLFQKALAEKSSEESIRNSIVSFYNCWIQNRPLLRGNGSIGGWMRDALLLYKNFPIEKTRYFAELEQRVLGDIFCKSLN